MRRDIIYKIFIDHYLLWAKKARSIKSYSLALIFLFQARRLASLSLDDDPMKDVSDKCEEIESLIETVLVDKNRDSQTKPQLPRRESYMDAGSRALFRVKNHERKGEDPYTNIDGVPSNRFDNTPIDTENNENVDRTKSPKFRKSIITSPKLNDHMARKNRTILKVQIHVEPNERKTSNSPIMPRSFYSPMTPSSPSSMSTSPKKLKFFNTNENDLKPNQPVELPTYINGLIPTSKTNGFEPSFHTNLNREVSFMSNASEDYVTEL